MRKSRAKIWEERARTWRGRAVFLEDEVGRLTRELEGARKLAGILEHQNTVLVDRITQLALQPPQVIDNKDAIQEITTGLANILNGWKMDPDSDEKIARTPSMGDLGLDNAAGVKAGEWFPDIEFDEMMEDPNKWPTRGGWVAGTPTTPSEQFHPTTPPQMPLSTAGMSSTQTTEKFQAGSSGPPPVGGLE